MRMGHAAERHFLIPAIKRYWRKLLPSTKEIIEAMKTNEFSQVKVLSYNTKERLLPKDAERELRLSVEWAKPFGVKVDFDDFWKEAGEIVRKHGRVLPQITLSLGIKT